MSENVMNHVSSSKLSSSDQHLDINQIIVWGYTRRIETKLTAEITIWTEIIKICCSFYENLLKIFIHSTKNKINILHIKTNQTSKIFLPNFSKSIFSKPLCYVNNITIGMNIPLDNRIDINARKMYDAIISIEAFNSTHRRYSTTNYHPNIMLFKASKIEHKCINVMSFISKKYLPVDCTTIGYKYGAHHFMYCGRNNGIIYEFDGDLYQLKLSNINIEAKDFNFTKIQTNQTHFWDHTNHHAFAQYLSMSYLKNMNKLFAIKCEWKRSQRIKTQTKCAVFDFIQSKWKWIKSLNTTTILDGYYAYEVCRNQYDMNLIYAVSNKGHTVKYDFIKNKWDMLADNSLSLKPYNKHIVWLDNPHILCCSDGTYFGYFDCRNSKPKWNKHKFANVLNDWSHTDPCVFF